MTVAQNINALRGQNSEIFNVKSGGIYSYQSRKNYLYLPTAGVITRVGEVLSDMPENQRHPGPPGWGLGVGLPFSSRKNSISPKPWQRGSYGPENGLSVIEEEK